MMLSYPLLEEPLIFDENVINVLVIENPVAYRNAVIELKDQSTGSDGSFVLSNDYQVLPFSKSVEVIVDVFFSENQMKKFTSKVNAEAVAVSRNLEGKVLDIIENLNELGTYITSNLDFDAIFTPLTEAAPIIKLLDITPEINSISLPEKILDYMRLSREFSGKDMFIINGLVSCMSDEETETFFKSVRYEKFNVLFIENHQPLYRGHDERITIVDNDLCVI